MKNIHKIGENIYITSDEEIKKGDWGYNTYTKSIHTIDVVGTKNNQWKKIILTTDQDLIKDGVQAIDDDFLQWFVSKANDSGVPIDIVEVHKMCYGALSGFSDAGYKIIIPKEEQKQHLIDMMQDDEKLGLYKRQTAVEWLEEQFNNPNIPNSQTLFNQAKEMEKIYYKRFFDIGIMLAAQNPNVDKQKAFDYWYNETFKNE